MMTKGSSLRRALRSKFVNFTWPKAIRRASNARPATHAIRKHCYAHAQILAPAPVYIAMLLAAFESTAEICISCGRTAQFGAFPGGERA